MTFGARPGGPGANRQSPATKEIPREKKEVPPLSFNTLCDENSLGQPIIELIADASAARVEISFTRTSLHYGVSGGVRGLRGHGR